MHFALECIHTTTLIYTRLHNLIIWWTVLLEMEYFATMTFA